ncbi:PAS domain S-box-containing protein [Pedobacter westerhofensis]|uniref:histidine kinase n=1 Tax=Pedobacter westerhofensis TaxID=425512 RepID=A0A521ET85_9SPHI|nr:PAS domain-containing sensor histidine kinase [Pedobacter westerhofensis]SMO87125.1 PAS domain S-box-containing protein [Pedobacter westerhofensis]
MTDLTSTAYSASEQYSFPGYPLLTNESERQEALDSYHILDTAEEKDFDDLTTLASAICQTPIALVSLVDHDRQWFKSHKGLPATETPRDYSFCAHAIASSDEIMTVPDATKDLRFAANPLVTGETNIVFYAGVPLVNDDGFSLGTLCVIDHHTRELSKEQISALVIIAKQVIDKLELRRKNMELRESNDRLNLALEAATLGSYDADMRTGMVSGTAQFRINFGLGADEALNFSDLFNVILPEYRENVEEMVNAAIMNNSVYQAEYEILWSDGSRHWISASGKPRYDQDGEVTRMVGVTQNITARKDLEQRQAEFLGVASHELKTPVTILKANLQLLDRYKTNPSNPNFPRLIDSAIKSMEKINHLVDDLLNMHRYGAGQLLLDKTIFNISEMLELCCNHVRVSGKHQLIVEGDPNIDIFADEHRIDQVVVNFVNNAVKYAPGSVEIHIGVAREGDLVKISVRDFGPGIPADQVPHLFDRYWRGDHSGAKYTGLGLGLYICAEIIKKHDGQIGAVSELGKGSTFWFTVPASLAGSAANGNI